RASAPVDSYANTPGSAQFHRLQPSGLHDILPGLRDGGASMRNTTRVVPLFPAILAVMLFSVIAAPAFAAGDDSPGKPAATAARPDHEKKVFTNDDIDQMWPKAQAAASVAPSRSASATRTPAVQKPAAV